MSTNINNNNITISIVVRAARARDFQQQKHFHVRSTRNLKGNQSKPNNPP